MSIAGMKKVVVIGGGSGSYSVLSGIKDYPYDITAIVTSFDSGGSSGLLKNEFGIIPPGDVRRCLMALMRGNSQRIFGNLFNFRFKEKSSLKGHNFGNIFLMALMQMLGDSIEAINLTGRILNIRGRVIPVSLDSAELCAVLEDGTMVKSETNIDIPKHNGSLRIRRVFLDRPAKIHNEAKNAILDADIIIIGPGDLYSSVIPNLLVSGMSQALRKSQGAKVYVANLMTKWGETNNFTASDHAREILDYAGLEKFDHIIFNNRPFSKFSIKKYKEENKVPVLAGNLKNYAKQIFYADLYNESDVLRHDSDRLAKIIERIAFPAKEMPYNFYEEMRGNFRIT
jgi:uncharacterized cofD-like protein